MLCAFQTLVVALAQVLSICRTRSSLCGLLSEIEECRRHGGIGKYTINRLWNNRLVYNYDVLWPALLRKKNWFILQTFITIFYIIIQFVQLFGSSESARQGSLDRVDLYRLELKGEFVYWWED
jgi:hypothetical protein